MGNKAIAEYWEQSGREKPRLAQEAMLRDLQRLGGEARGLYILDVGCGGGDYSLAWANAGATVFSLDFDAGRIKVVTEKAGKSYNNLHPVNGDAQKIPFYDNSFDFVICRNIIEHVDTPRALASEVVRVLKPGGRLILNAPNRLSLQQFFRDEHYRLPLVSVLPVWLAGFIVTKIFRYENKYSVRRIPTYYSIEKWFSPYAADIKIIQPDAAVIRARLLDPETIRNRILAVIGKTLRMLGLNKVVAEIASNPALLKLSAARFSLWITKKGQTA
jgi:ubiquinone/menaquinone biosynthesis C-methylase UbiE